MSAVLALPEVKAQLEPQLIFPISTSADSFGAFIREDTERWQRVVKDVGLQPKCCFACTARSLDSTWGYSVQFSSARRLTYLVPETLLFIPLFKMFAAFRELTGIELINHWWVLLLLYPTLTVPFCTWIMIGYFASIPKELDEAALTDGANYRQVLLKVFIPVALPGLIAATIFAFTVSWAQFLYPLAFTTSADQLVLPVGIVTTLVKGDVFNWGQIMTGALLGAAPPLIIYAFLMDYYIAGLTAGATKG